MSAKRSIFDGTKYIYAEQLKGRRVTLTIKKIDSGVEFSDPRGSKSKGLDLWFEETDKAFGVVGITVRRQVASALGTDDPDEMIGQKIILFPVESAKSATGKAIRVAKV